MADTQSENLKLEILRRILRELSEIKGFLENLSKISLKEYSYLVIQNIEDHKM